MTTTEFFITKFLEDIGSFCGATDTPVLDFWWRLLWVSKPERAALFTLDGGANVTHSHTYWILTFHFLDHQMLNSAMQYQKFRKKIRNAVYILPKLIFI